RRRAKKIRASLWKPGPPSILTGPVHPFGSLAALSVPPSGRLRAHSFAPPPHDGFAFVEDGMCRQLELLETSDVAILISPPTLDCVFSGCKKKSKNSRKIMGGAEIYCHRQRGVASNYCQKMITGPSAQSARGRFVTHFANASGSDR